MGTRRKTASAIVVADSNAGPSCSYVPAWVAMALSWVGWRGFGPQAQEERYRLMLTGPLRSATTGQNPATSSAAPAVALVLAWTNKAAAEASQYG